MTRFVTFAVVLFVAGALAPSASRGDETRPISDPDFLIKAVAAGAAEVQFGELAQKQAADSDVKSFANQMVRDHSEANKALLAHARGMKVAVVTGLDKDQRTAYANLSKLEGRDFDRQYVQRMVEDHKKAVSLFQDYVKVGKNEELRAFATHTLPTLKHHLEEAKSLLAKLAK